VIGRPGFFLHTVPAALYVLAVFYAGTLGQPPLPDVGGLPQDKIIHFFTFGLMQVVIYRAVRFELAELGLDRQLVVAAVSTSAVGALLELVQAALPHRSAELLDWLADTAGALLALFIMRRVLSRQGAAEAPARRDT
jgi:VanZ family protein